MSLQLDYYYGNEAESYSFYRIPKLLFTDIRFQSVSVEAKVLYGLMLDRMALSVKNNWLDEKGRVYIIFTIADVMETLGCAEQKVNKLLNELDGKKGVELVERVRRGLGKPNVIYVKNFMDKSHLEPTHSGTPLQESQIKNCENHKLEDVKITNQEMQTTWYSESQIENCENHKSEDVKITNQEMRKSQTNNTDLNKTDWSYLYPSIYPENVRSVPRDTEDFFSGKQKEMDGMDKMNAYRELLKENISYDILLQDNPYEKERLDGFVELMAEICCSNCKHIRINQSDMCTEVVKSRFLKLDSGHIHYVMNCLDKNTTRIGNIRAYTLSALFNAPATMSQYYASMVHHDMVSGVGAG